MYWNWIGEGRSEDVMRLGKGLSELQNAGWEAAVGGAWDEG